MVNQYCEISISINDIAMKKKTNFLIHIVFLNAYMPRMQCLNTFIVAYAHMRTYIHTYIYANNAFIQ